MIRQSLAVIVLALFLAAVLADCAGPQREEWRVLCVPGKAEGLCR